MLNSKYLYLVILCIIIIGCYLCYKYYFSNSKVNNNKQLLNQRFYDYRKVYPELEIFKDNRNKILEEVNKINNDEWKDWKRIVHGRYVMESLSIFWIWNMD